jgi:hypothetical protein
MSSDRKYLAERTALFTATKHRTASEVDRVRYELVIKMAREAVELGYSLSIADGNSSDEFLQALEKTGATVQLHDNQSMGYRRRKACEIAYATGRPFIGWLEPEKAGYPQFAHLISQPLLEDADMVIAGRQSLESYPRLQQQTEDLMNQFLSKLTRLEADWAFAPMTWRWNESNLFLLYDGHHGDTWDSVFIPKIDAIKSGLKVVTINVDYQYPEEQYAAENNDRTMELKRFEQLYKISEACHSHWHGTCKTAKK